MKAATAETVGDLRDEQLGSMLDPSPNTKPENVERTDCRDHLLTVFDGANFAGSLAERGAEFRAYDRAGALVGTFPDVRAAGRSLPRAS